MMAYTRHLLAMLVMASVLWKSNAREDDLLTENYPVEGGYLGRNFGVPGCENQKMDLIFILDTSENKVAVDSLKEVAVNMIQFANPDSGLVRIGIVAFSAEVDKVIELTKYTQADDIVSAIESLPVKSGRRDITGGIESMRQLFNPNRGDRSDAPNVALLLTTGNSVLRANELARESRLAHDEGISLFVVGVGVRDKSEFKYVASPATDETQFLVDDVADLAILPDVIYAQMCIRLQAMTVDQLRTSNYLDLVFLMHFSNKMTQDALQQIQDFMKSVVEKADIDSGAVRVGAAVYRRNAYPLFNLNQYTTRQGVVNGISAISLSHRSASTSAAAGLDLVKNDMLTVDNGNRVDVPDVIILLTDANSDTDVAETITAAQNLHKAGANVFAVGINLEHEDEVDAIASRSHSVYYLSSFEELSGVRDEIVEQINALQGKVASGQLDEDSPITVDNSRRADIAVVFHLSPGASVEDVESTFKSFLGNLFQYANINSGDVRIAFSNYRKNPNVLFHLQKHKTRESFLTGFNVIDRKLRGKQSDTAAAIEEARTQIFNASRGDRANVPDALIIITDDPSDSNAKKLQAEADDIKEAGVKVITIGINKADRRELYGLASVPNNENSFYVNDFDGLSNEAFVNSVRNTIYALQDVSSEVERVPVTRPPITRAPATERPQRLTTTTTTEAPVQGVDLSRSSTADLIFAIHFDPRRSDEDFQRLIRWLQGLVRKADIDSGNVRIGLYVDSQYYPLPMDRYTSRQDLVESLGVVPKSVARPTNFNLITLLRFMRTRAFVETGGDRPLVPNGLVIVTDTSSREDLRAVEAEARSLSESGVAIYTVGVGLTDKGEMERIATSPRNVFAVSDYEELEGNVNALSREIGALRAGDGEGAQPTTKAPIVEDCALARTDLLFVIDSSTSVTETNFAKILNFVKDFVSISDVDTGNVRVGVMIYSSEIYPEFQLNAYHTKAQILRAVDRITFKYGGTNTADAIKVMRNEMFTPVSGDRPDVPNVAVIITDGVSNVDSERTIPEAEAAHYEGIHIYAVGIGLTDTRELDAIASQPARLNSFTVQNFDDLSFLHQRIFASVCPKKYTTPVTPRRTTPTSTTTTTTRTTTTTTRPTTTTTRPTTTTSRPTTTTTRPTTRTTPTRPTTTTTTRTTTRTTPRTTTTTTPRPTTTPRRRPVYRDTGTDLVFMLDSTVNSQTFGWMKNFVARFSRQLDVDGGEYRVGAMTFGPVPRAEFHLNRYNFQDEIIGAAGQLQSSSGSVDTARAFDYVRETMFSSRYGDRPRARNYIVLLTGNERSLNQGKTYDAAERIKDLGTDIYTIGFNLRDTTEIDRISSYPVEEFRALVNSERQLEEIPASFIRGMQQARPPTTRVTTTTRRTTPTTAPRIIYPVSRFTGSCTSKADVVFVLDSSGSVGDENFDRVRNFTAAAISDLEIGDNSFRVAVITFSDNANIEFYLNTYSDKREILNAIRQIPYVYGYTHTAHALQRARQEIFNNVNGDRLSAPNMIVIVTDGESNINHLQTLPEAARIKNQGTTIITVAVGLEESENNYELIGLTSPPVEQNLIFVNDFEALDKLTGQIVTPLCTDTDQCEENPCQNDGVCVDGLRSYMCVCRGGYYGNNCEKQCGPRADVVFILDSSTSVGIENFDRIKTYAEALVRSMNVDRCDINVAAMKYSSSAMISFRLGGYRDTESIVAAINNIGYTRGQANMAEALRVVRTEIFNGRNGDRADAKNIAYLLTDGGIEINREITLSEADLIIDSGVRLIPLAIALRQKNEIELIAKAQGIPLLELGTETRLEEMSDQAFQALETAFESEDRCSGNPCGTNGRCITEGNSFSCECEDGFSGDYCENTCNGQADVVFVLDVSRYNSRTEVRDIKKFARDIVKRMAFRQGNFRVAVVEFGETARTLLTFAQGDNKKTVKAVIGNIRPQNGDPKPALAIQRVEGDIIGKDGDRENVPNYVIFVTTSVGGQDTIEAINRLRALGTKIIGVGINLSNSNRAYLESVVSEPIKDTLILVPNYERLESESVNFANFVCYQKNHCADNPCENGGICSNNDKDYMCSCRAGYAGKNCERSCVDQADIIFLLDMSGSVGFHNFEKIKDYLYHMVEHLNIGPGATQVGVATFSQFARAQFYLSDYTDKRKVQAAISGITYEYGNTNTAAGLKLVRSGMFNERRGDRPGVPDFALVITDGQSNVNAEQTVPEAELARKQGIHIFAIGVGLGDDWELRAIASPPSDKNAFSLKQYSDLWNISQRLLDYTCQDSGVCDENLCQNDGTCIPGIGTYTCKCLAGFLGKHCEQECQENLDICFVVDASASVGPNNFETVLRYIETLVQEFTVNGQEHRFSLITYSTEVKTIFSFNRYIDPAAVLDAINTTRYNPGATNTAGGLRQAHLMFQRGFGERPTAKNVVILLTDGESNINDFDTIPAATDIKSDGITLIGIGIGLTNAAELKSIASNSGTAFEVPSFNALDNYKFDVVRRSCEAERGEPRG